MSLIGQMASEKKTDMDASLQPLAEVHPESLPCRQSRGWHDVKGEAKHPPNIAMVYDAQPDTQALVENLGKTFVAESGFA